jgi:hypothetical protein
MKKLKTIKHYVEWSEKMMAARYDEQLLGLLYNRQFLCAQRFKFIFIHFPWICHSVALLPMDMS